MNYRRIEFQLYEYLVKLKDFISLSNENKGTLDKILNVMEMIRTKQYQVMVVGEFKRGKTSLYQAFEKIDHFFDENTKNHVEIKDWTDLNEDNDIRAQLENLEPIDAAIVVVSALSPFGNTEVDLVVKLLEKNRIKEILFAITFMDKIDEDEQEQFCAYMKKIIYKKITEALMKKFPDEKHVCRKKFANIGEHFVVVGISSTIAIEAGTKQDDILLQKSGILALKDEFQKKIRKKQDFFVIEQAIEMIKQMDLLIPEIYEEQVHYLQWKKQVARKMEINEILRVLDQEKEAIKEVFRKKFMMELNNVNPMEIEKVQQGIMRSTIQLYEYMNQEYHRTMEHQLARIFSQSMESCLEEYCLGRMKEVAINNIRNTMQKDINTLESVNFYWIESAMHQGNGMEQVSLAINSSLDAYYTNLKLYIEKVKTIIDGYIDDLMSGMNGVYTTTELQLATYQVNYKRLEQELDSMIAYCQDVLQKEEGDT